MSKLIWSNNSYVHTFGNSSQRQIACNFHDWQVKCALQKKHQHPSFCLRIGKFMTCELNFKFNWALPIFFLCSLPIYRFTLSFMPNKCFFGQRIPNVPNSCLFTIFISLILIFNQFQGLLNIHTKASTNF